MTITNVRSTPVRVVALALAVLGLMLMIGTTSADARIGNPTGKLTVTPYHPGSSSNVAVFGYARMTRPQAQALINSGHRIVLRLWGEDTFSDDLLIGPYNATVFASSRGLEFHKVLLNIDNDTLDEDWGEDDLYVGMRLVNASGSTIRSGETNRVWGHF